MGSSLRFETQCYRSSAMLKTSIRKSTRTLVSMVRITGDGTVRVVPESVDGLLLSETPGSDLKEVCSLRVMGNMMGFSDPITRTQIVKDESGRIKFGCASVQGWRIGKLWSYIRTRQSLPNAIMQHTFYDYY